MKTIQDVFRSFKQELAGLYAPSENEAITLLVLCGLLNMSRAKVKAFPETVISEEQAGQLQNILHELKTGKPVQYILGETEFYGLPFKVNPSVLIPRPETEELVQWIIQSVNDLDKPIHALLDIGTGSGCIAVTLKKHLPNIDVFAIDISADAINTAKSNAVLNNTSVAFTEADILNLNSGVNLPKLDLIVSNPPYVTNKDKLHMHYNVTDFEPHTALFVPEDDPLLFYRAIAHFAKKRLNSGGQLFFEINESYGLATVELLQKLSFKNIELRKDLPGRDRMVKADI